jgi:hypothetical protein
LKICNFKFEMPLFAAEIKEGTSFKFKEETPLLVGMDEKCGLSRRRTGSGSNIMAEVKVVKAIFPPLVWPRYKIKKADAAPALWLLLQR